MTKIERKQVVIKEIKDKLVKASSIVLVNSRGLTVEQDTILRRKLREEGVDYKVYKNTMINFAVADTDFAGIAEHLEGPTTLAICYDDPTAAARIISNEKKAMPVLEFKAAVIEKTLYDAKGVTAIANIPGREVLLGRLLGSLKSPVATFARVVKAIAEELEKGDIPSAEAPVEAVAEEAPAPAVEEAVAEAPAEEPKVEEPEANEPVNENPQEETENETENKEE